MPQRDRSEKKVAAKRRRRKVRRPRLHVLLWNGRVGAIFASCRGHELHQPDGTLGGHDARRKVRFGRDNAFYESGIHPMFARHRANHLIQRKGWREYPQASV